MCNRKRDAQGRQLLQRQRPRWLRCVPNSWNTEDLSLYVALYLITATYGQQRLNGGLLLNGEANHSECSMQSTLTRAKTGGPGRQSPPSKAHITCTIFGLCARPFQCFASSSSAQTMANPRQRRKLRSGTHRPVSHSKRAQKNLKKTPRK